jgi:hypothetical protein
VRLTGTSTTPSGLSAAQRAYASGSASGVVAGQVGGERCDTAEISGAGASAAIAAERKETNLSRLVAGVVSGRVEFDEFGVAQVGAGDSIAMYRRPADRNAAATGVSAGRLIDVRG